jgi:AcrR family transcriptional regulator
MLTSTAERPPRRKGGRDVRTAILKAARRLYFAHGTAGVTARGIAAVVGVSPTAIYLYFRNLGDVLEHLRMEGHGLLADALRAVDPALPAVERVRGMGRAYYAFGLAHPRYYDLMFRFGRAERPRRAAVQREMYTLMLLRDAVQRGVERGEIRNDLDPMVITNALWSQIHGVTALAASGLLLETAAGHHAEVLEGVLESSARWLAPERRQPGRRRRSTWP